MMKTVQKRPGIGDVFSIPLSDGRKAYGQYVFWDGTRPAGLGSLVRIFDVVRTEPVSLEELRKAKNLFPPVFVGLGAGLKSRGWKIIGQLPLEGFRFPKFRVAPIFTKGKRHDWQIWDGEKMEFLGELPERLRSLEVKVGWGAAAIEERILTGRNQMDFCT
jgi:immunity protein 26 of polymorphic toxin system